MKQVKKILGITANKYEFDWNDIRALGMLVNVVLVMTIGLWGSVAGLALSAFWLVVDYIHGPRVNGLLMNCASIILNIYFITQI